MNFKPSILSPIKLFLLIAAVAALTIFFIYAQMMRQSFLISVLFLALIIIVLLSKRYSAIHSNLVKILLFSILIYVSIEYGIFFTRARYTQIIGFFTAILLTVLFFNPKLMTYLNLVFILFITSSPHGIKGYDELLVTLGGIFGRGQGKYGISYVNLLLIFTAISIIVFQMIIKKQEDKGKIQCNLYKYFWVFNAVFFIYILWGITLGINKIDILSPKGVINITNLTILVFIMHRLFRTEKDLEQLKMFFLGSMLVRGIWAIGRFIFFGGDPRNPYANYSNIPVTLTMHDIGDGIIQCIALFYALWMLLNMGDKIKSKKESLFYWMIASVGLFNIVFSYRRTAWFGLLLALSWLILNLRVEKRIFAGLVTLIIGAIIFTGVAANRFEAETVEKRKQGMFSDIHTKEGNITFKEGRFLELYMAWETIKDNILFGVGPWGEYKLNTKGSGVRSSFTHSSVFHVLLKTGIVGLFVFILIFYSYIHFWLTKRKEISMHVRGFAEASFAGFIFFIPGILGGTPIIEYRHMMLIGFCLSIPYIIYHINKSHKAVSPN